jgi:hypothetical protein
VLSIDRQDKGTNLTLELPDSLKRIHPTFAAEYCKIYISETKHFPDRSRKSARPEPVIIVDEEGKLHEYFNISKILDHRMHYKKLQLLVFYEGYTEEDAEWVPYSEDDETWNNGNDRTLAHEYLAKHKLRKISKTKTEFCQLTPQEGLVGVGSDRHKSRKQPPCLVYSFKGDVRGMST